MSATLANKFKRYLVYRKKEADIKRRLKSLKGALRDEDCCFEGPVLMTLRSPAEVQSWNSSKEMNSLVY